LRTLNLSAFRLEALIHPPTATVDEEDDAVKPHMIRMVDVADNVE
jgi:NitT/TauT family transport system ATP-binding protein